MEIQKPINLNEIRQIYSNLSRNIIHAYKNNLALRERKLVAIKTYENILTIENWTQNDRALSQNDVDKVHSMSDQLRDMIDHFFGPNAYMDGLINEYGEEVRF